MSNSNRELARRDDEWRLLLALCGAFARRLP